MLETCGSPDVLHGLHVLVRASSRDNVPRNYHKKQNSKHPQWEGILMKLTRRISTRLMELRGVHDIQHWIDALIQEFDVPGDCRLK